MRTIRAPRRARFSRALLAASGVILVSAVGVGGASAQGLFEALFGRSSYQPAPQYYPAPAPSPRLLPPGHGYDGVRRTTPRRVTRDRQRQDALQRRDRSRAEARAARVVEAPAKPAPYVAPPVMPGPLGRFLRDSSLRAGDVVATSEGLMVFRGSGGSRHAEKDFVPLSKASRYVAQATRSELAKLDSAVRTGGSSPIISMVAENSPPIVAQDETRSRR